MTGTSLTFKGIEQLGKKLKKNATLADVKNIVKLSTSEMQKEAQKRAAVDTGFMKRYTLISFESSGLDGLVTALADYSPYVEYGTRFQTAQPFIRPAFMIQKLAFVRDMQRLVK